MRTIWCDVSCSRTLCPKIEASTASHSFMFDLRGGLGRQAADWGQPRIPVVRMVSGPHKRTYGLGEDQANSLFPRNVRRVVFMSTHCRVCGSFCSIGETLGHLSLGQSLTFCTWFYVFTSTIHFASIFSEPCFPILVSPKLLRPHEQSMSRLTEDGDWV